MRQFEIKNIDTFPKQIRDVLECGVKELSDKHNIKTEKHIEDYVDSNTWNQYDGGELRVLYEELSNTMEQFSIVGYHNTRLLNPDSVYNKGLFFTEDKYFQQIENDMRMQGILDDDIKFIVKQVKYEIDWRISGGNKHRARSIDFVNSLDTTKKYEMYFVQYGGECFKRALNKDSLYKSTQKYENILTMGKPYSVKFAVPFGELDNRAKDKVVRRVLEYGLRYFIQNKKQDISDDFTICREVSPNEIVDVILYEENFALYCES